MHHTHPSHTPETASHLPPLSAVGWFTSIVRELGRRRAIRQEFGRMSPALLRDIGLTDADVDAVRLQKLADDAASGLALAIRERGDNW